ncbi:MAG: hypothetical protein GX853_02570 [Chloroflexi bacterium]|nr:hypothetical protein [Chloroflexota bacterium]
MDNEIKQEFEEIEKSPEKSKKVKDFFHHLNIFLIKNTPGMRVIKTMIAIFICLLIEAIRQKTGTQYHSSIAAVVCMQPTLKSTTKTARERVIGTLIAGLYAFLVLTFVFPALNIDRMDWAYFLVTAVLSLPLMTLMIWIRTPGPIAITVIVFLIITLKTTDTTPIAYTLERVGDTLIGISVAMLVNWFPPLNKLGKKMGQVEITAAPATDSQAKS